MNDKRITHLNELCTHKKLLIDSCNKLAVHFLSENEEDLALEIMRRAFVHDISKISKYEFHTADAFDKFNKHTHNRHHVFSDKERLFLEEHWRNNRHHPEHWENINDMSDMDIAEMVCDWHSRSVEFEDDLMDYIKYRQENRFKFPEHLYKRIIEFANILLK